MNRKIGDILNSELPRPENVQIGDNSFKEDFIIAMKFLKYNSDRIVREDITLKKAAEKMLNGRKIKALKKIEDLLPSKNKGKDQMIAFILENSYNLHGCSLEKALLGHECAMAAENIVGSILEAYIDSQVKERWIWCSGNIVKAVDFIKRHPDNMNEWPMLQIKNRSNSENSSSSAIREGTQIRKWYRSNASTGGTMWNDFPDEEIRTKLSEDGFKNFVKRYLMDT